MRREDQPIDESRRETLLRELRRRLRRPERRQRRVRDLAREVDDAAGQRVTRRQDGIETRERVEAVQAELRLAGQALDRRAGEAVLQVLTEQQPIALERSRDREPRLELADEGKPFPKPGIRLSGLKTQSLVPRLVRTCVTLVENRPYSAAKGFDSTSTDSTAPLGSSRSKSPGRRVVEAGTAHLQRAGRRRTALDAQPALRAANDAREHRQQRLKIVAGQRLDIHLRAGEEVADRHRLQALRGRVGGHDDLHALAHERQAHLDEDLLGLAAVDVEPRRLAVGKAVTLRLHHIGPRRARPGT